MDDPLAEPPHFSDEDTVPTPTRHSVRQKTGLSSFKKFFVFVGGCLVVAGIAYGALRVLSKKSKPAPVKQAVVQDSLQALQNVPKDVPDAGSTKEYKNDALGLKLSYPDTWKVSDTADQGVRIQSPEFSFISNEEGTVAGFFRIYIRRGARESDSKYIGRGYAVAASEKLTYTNPSNDQRKETLITRFGLDEPTNFAYFFIAGNFQLSKGDTLGPNYGKEADTYIIAGGFSGSKLTDDMATYSVAADLPTTSNAYKQAVAIIASLQLN